MAATGAVVTHWKGWRHDVSVGLDYVRRGGPAWSSRRPSPEPEGSPTFSAGSPGAVDPTDVLSTA